MSADYGLLLCKAADREGEDAVRMGAGLGCGLGRAGQRGHL